MTGFDAPQPKFTDILALHGKWLGDKPALVMGERLLDWRSFDATQIQVANGLIALGVSKGDRVALITDNSIEMLEAMFGILRAGAVIVPLNLAVAPEGMQAMLQDSAVSAVFVSAPHVGRMEAVCRALPSIQRGGRIVIGGRADGWTNYDVWRDAQNSENPGVETDDDDLFNIIYSSGTTGLPKGIAHTQSRRLAFARDLGMTCRFDTQARTLVNIGLYSNISMSSALFTLLVGGTVHIHEGFSPLAVLDTIQKHRITHLFMVPIQFQMIWEMDGFDDYDLSSLKCLLSVGSALHLELKQKLLTSVGQIVIEAYGLTEGPLTVIDGEDCVRLLGSVGKPIFGTDIRIINGDGVEVPAGIDGEIVGRGPHNMPYYYNNPTATEDSTWVSPEGDKWLKTGDLGRLDEDGFLYIVGRLKDMIVSGGQNIYPSDIEAVMITHPDVNDVAVIGVPHEKWDETPFAIVVPEPGSSPDAAAITDWVNQRVGKRQRITGVDFATELPRNPNGKILKRVLREPYWG